MGRLLLLVLAAGLLLGRSAEAAPLRVVCTFSILADMVAQVGGPEVIVTTLVAYDGDTHVFEPTPADLKRMGEADLVIANGLGFEPWLQRLVAQSRRNGPVVLAGDGIAPRAMADGTTDPHVWQDLANGQRMVANIASALARAAPERAALFELRADAYSRRLAELDSWVRVQMAEVPAAKRQIITSHDALGYFGRAYDVELVAPQGFATDAEPTARAIARLADQIRARKIRAVFLENMANPRLMAQLARDTGAVVGGTLYTDALSPPSGPAPDYVRMFRHNVTTLIRAMRKNQESRGD